MFVVQEIIIKKLLIIHNLIPERFSIILTWLQNNNLEKCIWIVPIYFVPLFISYNVKVATIAQEILSQKDVINNTEQSSEGLQGQAEETLGDILVGIWDVCNFSLLWDKNK